MIHSSAHAHGVLTKASSLPREHPLLSMPAPCQPARLGRNTQQLGGLAVSEAQAANSSGSYTLLTKC